MNKLIFLLCFFIPFWMVSAYAASVKGGSISYTCQGNNVYKIRATINRECSGTGISNYQMDVFNGLGTVAMSASRISIRDVSPICSKATLPCTSPNQASAPGIEEHVYEATVDFNSSTFNNFLQNRTGNCKVYFSFETSGRDSLNTMSHGQFFIVAMLDICLSVNSCNNSAYSDNISAVSLCCYQPFSYNPGMFDGVDNDSIAMDTLTPKTGKNSIEQFVQSYSQMYPVTPYCPPNPGVINCRGLPNAKPPRGLHFDPAGGDLVFTPTRCDERSAIVFRAYEYRTIKGKAELVGFSEKEVGFNVKQCPDNNPPQITGGNNYSVCEGNKLCFTIVSKDDPFLPKQTVPDTVQLTWDSTIMAATFKIIDPSAREKQAQFCWQTRIGDVRAVPYNFSAKVKDDFCPIPATASRIYSITVKPKARDTRVYTKSFKGRLIMEATPSPNANYSDKNYTYKYTVRDSANSGTPLFMTYNRKDSFKFITAGRYIIEHEINNPPLNCPSIYTDTINITAQHLTDIPSVNKARIAIVPNPSQGIFSISSEDMDLSGTTVRVFAVDGRMVYESILNSSEVNVSLLPKGIYVLEISGDYICRYERIVIE